MKIILSFFIVLVSFCCCEKDNDNNSLSVTIDNNSNVTIEDAMMYVNIGVTENNFTDSISFGNIEKSNSVSKKWNLENLSKTDGDFYLKFTSDTLNREIEFGYFTNGNLIDHKYDIQIKNDTIIVEK